MTQGTVLLEFTVPSVWPPAAGIAIFRARMNASIIQVAGEPEAMLRFVIQTANGVVSFETPPLTLPDYAFLKVALTWDDTTSPSVAINGVLLSDSELDAAGYVSIRAKSKPPTGFRNEIIISVQPEANAIDSRFLGSIADLQMRLRAGTLNDLLDASGILRRLFTDERPLVHLVNRAYGLRPHFTVAIDGHRAVALEEEPTFVFSNPSPDFADETELEQLSFDKFLALPLLRDGTRTFSARDVIDVCANTKGGIHFGTRKTPESVALLEIDRCFQPFLIEASLAALPGLAWSAINGLRPLIHAMQCPGIREVGDSLMPNSRLVQPELQPESRPEWQPESLEERELPL